MRRKNPIFQNLSSLLVDFALKLTTKNIVLGLCSSVWILFSASFCTKKIPRHIYSGTRINEFVLYSILLWIDLSLKTSSYVSALYWGHSAGTAIKQGRHKKCKERAVAVSRYKAMWYKWGRGWMGGIVSKSSSLRKYLAFVAIESCHIPVVSYLKALIKNAEKWLQQIRLYFLYNIYFNIKK